MNPRKGKKERMKVLWFSLLLAVGAVFAHDDEGEDMGTVVGIDLGTTYSW